MQRVALGKKRIPVTGSVNAPQRRATPWDTVNGVDLDLGDRAGVLYPAPSGTSWT
jgi:hypothetical protein